MMMMMVMMVIGDSCGCGGVYEIHIITPPLLLSLQNKKNVEMRMGEINIARIKNPVSCLIAGLS